MRQVCRRCGEPLLLRLQLFCLLWRAQLQQGLSLHRASYRLHFLQ
ncbi:hypothetical protein EVA_10145 [gut metagenome]|uniref:Uncharacterized protein n=1 Tax=gut metagenome TaxID=749906 RepID=J9GP71_9ZZZZ